MTTISPVDNAAAAVPTMEELVERASALVPMLREKAESVEKNRKVSSETIQAFMDAGFFKILQPKRWGGWEMNPEVFFRILMELGRGCGSSTWNMMVLGLHQWQFGHMETQAGDDVWGEDPNTIIASAYAPTGKATRVEGGYMLEGQWPTSSGCDHGTWTFLGAFIRDENGTIVERCSFLVPREDYEIIDDWYVFGLAGTGSKSVKVKKAFVPDHRVKNIFRYEMSDRGNNYLWPFTMVFTGAVASAIVGMGRQAIEIYTEQMGSRVRQGTNEKLSLSPYVKDRVGNAKIKVNSARARMLQMMKECTPYAERRELTPLDDQVLYLAEMAHVGRDVEAAALLLYKAGGAQAAFLHNPLQRVLRDILVASNHSTQNADDTTGALGAYLLDGEIPVLLRGGAPNKS